MGLGFASIFAVGLIAADPIATTLHVYLRPLVSVCLAGMVFGVVLILVGEFRRIKARVEFYGEVENRTRERVEGNLRSPSGEKRQNGDVHSVDLLTTTLDQMNNYDAIARGQAASSYLASLGAMLAGLALLATGILIAYFATNASTKYAAAFLTAVGSITGGYISKTFLSVQERATKQLSYYFQQPLIQSYVLMAERLTQNLDKEEQNHAIKSIIGGMVNLLRVSPLEASSKDSMPKSKAASDAKVKNGRRKQ
ncbi:hypothetical protein HC031_05220 [Planosporangium thailandense]|uniref:Cyanobacterial TRADD-N associated 2 transmembrane domain-containing protein n=1 Tax=Planosporangium thailandense TaxID=765197 RepID=A0ABX0XSZ1_9ACTN|nr:hypothetical protein [Planosporangium thailandense]NJC69122.1 hypothetical protein [Planosporangium thailandense]